MSSKGKSVYVAGHRGMVGSALVRRLAREDVRLVTVDRRELDLCNQAAVFDWFAQMQPQVVFLAAAQAWAPPGAALLLPFRVGVIHLSFDNY